MALTALQKLRKDLLEILSDNEEGTDDFKTKEYCEALKNVIADIDESRIFAIEEQQIIDAFIAGTKMKDNNFTAKQNGAYYFRNLYKNNLDDDDVHTH